MRGLWLNPTVIAMRGRSSNSFLFAWEAEAELNTEIKRIRAAAFIGEEDSRPFVNRADRPRHTMHPSISKFRGRVFRFGESCDDFPSVCNKQDPCVSSVM